MTAGLPSANLQIDADLHLDVDGVAVHITGDGSVLRVRTDRPLAVARQARQLLAALAVGVRSGRLGAVLHDTGLDIELSTRRGVLLRLGGGGARPSVRPGPAVVLPLAAGLGALGAVGALAAAVTAAVRRRRR